MFKKGFLLKHSGNKSNNTSKQTKQSKTLTTPPKQSEGLPQVLVVGLDGLLCKNVADAIFFGQRWH